MGIYTFDESLKIHPEIERYRTKEELQTSTKFSTDGKLGSIIQYISGMSWELESYFTQVGNVNDQISEISLESGFEQSYYRISKLKVYLQSPLNTSIPDELKGEFIVNANFLPKKYDHFIANVFGGRLGLFTITEITKNDYNNHPCYECSFELHCFLENENIEYYNKLIEKTVKDFVYDDNYKFNQNTPVLTTNEYNIMLDIKTAMSDLVNYYFKNFINNDNKILYYPTEEKIYTDTYLLEFIYKTISINDYPELSKIYRVDYKDPKINNTILDAILLRNPQILNRCDKYLDFIPVEKGNTNLTSRHISLIDIDYIVGKVEENNTEVEKIEIKKNFEPNYDANILVTATDSVKQAVKNIVKKHNDDFLFSNIDLNLAPEYITKDQELDYLEKEEVIEEETENKNEDIVETTEDNNIEIEEKENTEEVTDNNVEDNEVSDVAEETEESSINEETVTEIENVEEKKEVKNDIVFDNIDFNLNNIEIEEVVEEPKPIKIPIQPIKATKQYSLFKKK